MRKFYILALAAALAIPAVAENVAKAQKAEVVAKVADRQLRTAVAATKTPRPMKLKAEDYAKYEWTELGKGKYVSSVVAGTYGSSADPQEVTVYEAKDHKGVYKAVGVWADILNNTNCELVVDASNPSFITVPKQTTNISDNVDGITYIASQTWVLNEEKGYSPDVIISQASDIVPTLKDGVITFPVNALVLNWPEAPADSKYGTDATKWYVGAKNPGQLVLPGATYVEPWKEMGKATMSGDFYFNTFNQTPTDYEVTVFQSTSNPAIIKVEQALKGLFTSLQFTGNSPDFEFDLTDPKNVILDLTSTKINGGNTDGIYYACTANSTYEKISDCPEDQRVTFTETNSQYILEFPAKSLIIYASTSNKAYYGNSASAKLVLKKESAEITDTPEIDGITYKIDFDTKLATVTGAIASCTNLNVPATFEYNNATYTVTSVAKSAFQNSKTVTAVSLPTTIKTVDTDAFRNMSNLKEVNIQDLKAWCKIVFANGNANPIYNVFPTSTSKWGSVKVNGKAVTTLEIPEGVDSIGRSFYGFKALTAVSLPSSLRVMGDQSFSTCNGLTEVTIPEGVTTMGTVFYSCTGLKKVKLPSTLTKFTSYTFSGCSALESIELPASITELPMMLLYGCTGLKSITSLNTTPPAVRNMAFENVDKTIPVYVPAASVEAYKSAEGWAEFTNIQEIPGSSVTEIEANDEEAVYFDMNGRRISGELLPGIYVRVQGSKASKVMIK